MLRGRAGPGEAAVPSRGARPLPEAVAQWISYLLTDPTIVGVVGWAGLFATVVGLSVAIGQIRGAKTAAQAAASAPRGLANEIRSREGLLELATARGHLENANSHVVRREFRFAGVFIDLAHAEIVRVKALVESPSHERKSLDKVSLRLTKLSETLIRSEDEGSENDDAVPLAIELKA